MTVSEEKNFECFFFLNFALYGSQQPIKIKDKDKSNNKRGTLLNKHFYKNKIQIFAIGLQK